MSNFLRETIRTLLPVAIIAAGVIGFAVFGKKAVPQTDDSHAHREVLVETEQIDLFDGAITIEIDGVAAPYRQVTLSAEVSGRVTFKAEDCKSGSFVSQGESLLRIDSRDYNLDVKRLQAQQRQASEDLAATDVEIENVQHLIQLAEEDLVVLRSQLERDQKLIGTRAISADEIDEARRQVIAGRNAKQTLENQLAANRKRGAALQASLDFVGVQLEQAHNQLTRTHIIAPLEGVVVEDLVEEGDYVKVGDPLLSLSAATPMEVRCDLRIDQLYWIWLSGGEWSQTTPPSAADAHAAAKAQLEIPRLPVEVHYEFEGATIIWDGVLDRYEGTGLDALTRTLPCRILVESPTKARVLNPLGQEVIPPRLFSGMFTKVKVSITPPLPLLKLPKSAVRPGGIVWTTEASKLKKNKVRVVRVADDFVLIEAKNSTLRPGAQVVHSPLVAPQEGQPIKVDSPDLSNAPSEQAAL